MIEKQRDESMEGYLSRVLLALARQSPDHQLIIKNDTFALDVDETLAFDVDSTGNLIIRALGRHAVCLKVPPRAAAWTIPFEERAARLGARGRIPTDADLAEAEQARNMRRSVRAVAPPVTEVPNR